MHENDLGMLLWPDSMWAAETKQLDPRSVKNTVHWNGARLSVHEAYELLSESAPFRQAFIDALSALPFPAYFWETPPLTKATAVRPFEYVVTDAPQLAAVSPEVQAFSEHFGKDVSGAGVVAFENLSRDAMLVVPCPIAEQTLYTHLGAFIRGAPRAQVHALLGILACAVLERMNERPLWVSTAGMGVYWLHVRLDSRPKYYRHKPYT